MKTIPDLLESESLKLKDEERPFLPFKRQQAEKFKIIVVANLKNTLLRRLQEPDVKTQQFTD